MSRSYPFVALLSLAALTMALLCAVFLWRMSSPWPNGDMWGGQLIFLIRMDQGFDFLAFFDQHNEHRIALTRLLFLLDDRLFGGSNASLFAWNFLLAAGFWALFLAAIWRETAGQARIILAAFAGVLAFSLAQAENFGWAFQSQFFLAYVLPFATYS